jgi:hypothetical protein
VATWERIGDAWVNLDQVELLEVEERQEEGRWHLKAGFTSGRTCSLSSSTDRETLVDYTDLRIRGKLSDHLFDKLPKGKRKWVKVGRRFFPADVSVAAKEG